MILFIVLIFVVLIVIGHYLSKKLIPVKEKKSTKHQNCKVISVGNNGSKVIVKGSEDSGFKITKDETPIEKDSKPNFEVKKIDNYHWTNKIGYEPNNIFLQNEPFSYPFVLMPKTGCRVTIPKDGGGLRKGFTEDKFYKILESYFNSIVEYSNYKILFPIGNRFGYEPDISIIDSKNNINLYIDVEIDEPYEGLNDIRNRKPTHCMGEDSFRNKDFTENGWIVIRFAEIQIYQTPIACCQFIAQVINSVNPNFTLQLKSHNQDSLKTVKQWSITMAKIWSGNKYREEYLGIHSFGSYEVENIIHVQEVKEPVEIINKVKIPLLEKIVPKEKISIDKPIKINNLTGRYISFEYNNYLKLIRVTNDDSPEYFKGYCYISNSYLTFDCEKMNNIKNQTSYYSQKVINRSNNLYEIKECISEAISRKKSIRIVYAKQERNYINVDEETGEIIQNHIEAEVSLRSVSDIDLAINVLPANEINTYFYDENYVTGFCHLRNEHRTFKFQRIKEIEVLKI
jgi:hypothetical protein